MQLPVTFMYPAVLALSILVVPVLWLRRKRQPAVGHPQVGIHANLKRVPLVGRMPTILFTLWFVALVMALSRPVLPTVNETRTIQTRDTIVAVDISGSMGGSIPNAAPPANQDPGASGAADTSGQPQQYRRLDAARDAAEAFVQRRQGDRIGLIEFDDETYYNWPLTDDLKIITRKAKLLNRYVGGGTNFQGPTDNSPKMGPLQAALDHFRDYGKAKTKVLIMVTDGEDSISPERFEQLAAAMEAAGIRLYVLGVGDGWTSGNTPDLQKFAERLNGQVFRVGDAGALQAAFDKINQLETSTVQLERTVTYRDVYQLFVGASVILMLLFLGSVLVTREEA